MDAELVDGVVARLRAAGCVFAEEEAAVLIEAATSSPAADDGGSGAGGVDAGRLERMVRERVGGRPLEAVVGWAEFAGMRVLVDDRVFVPRRRTEVLVGAAAAGLREGAVVVDLCCGTGAVGLALLAEAERRGIGVEVTASDVDERAVACARRNLEPRGAAVVGGDLFDALPRGLRGRIDVLAVNAPYVPTDGIATMPPEAREHEPAVALDGGSDGLDVHRRVAAEVAVWLAPGGIVVIESSAAQAPRTAALLAAQGLVTSITHDDDVDGTAVTGRA